MNEMYFVIHNGEGDTIVDAITKDVLLERIGDGYWGDVTFLDKLPDDKDTNHWGCNVLIIKGSVVTPQPVNVITEFKIE
jgi:hypothetical protein